MFMSELHKKNCIPCRGGVPQFDITEIHKYLNKNYLSMSRSVIRLRSETMLDQIIGAGEGN